MDLQEIKRNLNKMVDYKGVKGVYKLTACIIRKNEEGFFYQAELTDTTANSISYCKLSEITEGQE